MGVLAVRHFLVLRRSGRLLGHGILWAEGATADSARYSTDGYTEVMLLGTGRHKRDPIRRPTLTEAMREAHRQCRGCLSLVWLERRR